MIGWVIQAKNINWKAKKWKRSPKSSKNKIFVFGLCSTSEDWPSNPSDKQWLKCKKRPPKSLKNKIFIFWWSTRRLPEDHQKTARRPTEDHQKPLAVFWQSSNTMIQGNFYKRLHFYMDSCAISPMASLFVEYTEKKTSVFQIQLEFWVNITLCFWLIYPPPLEKLGFVQVTTFPIFSHQSGSEWLRMANFPPFTIFPIFSHWSGSEWLRTANLAWFTTFPIFPHWSGSEWLGMANFAQFATFPILYHQSG